MVERTQVIGPGSLDTSTSQGVGSLKSRLQMNSNRFFGEAAQISSEQGARAGQMAGLETDEFGEAIPPELKEGITEYQKQYNRAALDSYAASLNADVRNEMNRIYMENPDDSEFFVEKVNAYRDGLMDEVPDELKAAVGNQIEKERNSKGLRVAAADMEKSYNEALGGFNEDIQSAYEFAVRAIREGDEVESSRMLGQALDAIDVKAQNGFYNSPEEVEAAKNDILKGVREEQIKNQVVDAVENYGEGTAFQVIKELQDNIPEWASPDDWDAFMTSVIADANQAVTVKKKQRTEQDIERQIAITDLKIASKDPSADAGAIIMQAEALFRDPDSGMTQKQYESIKQNVFKGQQDQRDALQGVQNVANRINGDPSIVLSQKEVDDYYELNKIGEKGNADIASYVYDTKMLPNPLKHQIKQGLISGDVETIKRVSDLMDRIDEMPGVGLADFSAYERAFANKVNLFAGLMDSEKTVKQAMEAVRPGNQPLREEKQQEIKDKKFHETDAKNIDGFLDRGSFGRWWADIGPRDISPVNKARMKKQFQQVRDELYTANYGDKSETDEKAWQLVSSNYGDFMFGDRNMFMEYPPSIYYNSTNGTDYIADQAAALATMLYNMPSSTDQAINDWFASGAEIPPEWEIITPDRIHLDTDQQTAREATGGAPTYLMSIMDDNGQFVPSGRRFMPDVMAEEQGILTSNPEFINAIRMKAEERVRAVRESLDRASLGAL